MSCQPGRASDRSGRTGLPHHDATMTSGSRRTTSARFDDAILGELGMCRSSGKIGVAAGDLDQLLDPLDARDQRIVPLLEVDARPARQLRRARRESRRGRAEDRLTSAAAWSLLPTRPPSISIIWRISATDRWLNVTTGWPRADELGGDVGLQIGEREDQVGRERLDLLEPRVDERRDARLLPRLRRPHRVTGHADDPIAFAEQIQRLGRLFGQADDALRIWHADLAELQRAPRT